MSSSGMPWLESLNTSQRKAVESDPEGSLQILAGPGSGKTRVLTCRVAYLIKHTGIDPSDLVVVTFTNKAANEMKHRLHVLLGAKLSNKIVNMGTFHGVCVKFLRKYGSKVGLKPNWVICDWDQQLAYCKSILHQPSFAARNANMPIKLKPNVVLNYISKKKSRGEAVSTGNGDLLMDDLYKAYQAALNDDNCLDFDDLLTYGEMLFRCHPQVVVNVKHVLIDEFQDTNVVQYEMMRHLAHSGAVTIVGDPDQGIYGWRSAEVGNLNKMVNDIPNTMMIFLEENYRSSSRILNASLAVVQQDTMRIDKSLYTTHPEVSFPVLRAFPKPQEESEFIVQEIQRVIAHTGGQLTYDDFSILLRYNALSRNLEAALQSAGIPSRMVGGQKFFERAEVKDILAYLQLADNPTFVPAFERIINVPKRAIGVTTIKAIKEAAKASGVSPIEILIRSVKGKDYPGLSHSHRSKFKIFLAVIFKIQTLARSGASIVEIIDTLLNQIDYEAHLRKQHDSDAVHRYQNVQELKAFAVHLDGGELKTSSPPSSAEIEVVDKTTSKQDIADMMEAIEAGSLDEDEEPTSLRRFLTESMLSTDTEAEDSKETNNIPKVTISTCHASKGLEWPVVFIPAVENGTFPFYLSVDPESIKEERRLLFVAMTRAQGLLYMTHCQQRMAGAESRDRSVSQFVSSLTVENVKSKTLKDVKFTQSPPKLGLKMRKELASILGRPLASDADVDSAITKYNQVPRKDFEIINLKASGKEKSVYTPSNPSYNRWGSSSQPSASASFQPTSNASSQLASTGPRPFGFNRPGSKLPSIPAGRFVNSEPALGFSSAFTLHQSQVKTGIGGGKGKGKDLSAAFIPQIPRDRFVNGGGSITKLPPEVRLSRGAEPTSFLIGVNTNLSTTTNVTKTSLANFQASSSSKVMEELKRSIPPDVVTLVGLEKRKEEKKSRTKQKKQKTKR
ncbi:hypothetical protein CROQUDRAFT_658266 [Cronartium quercuum f. sp. fusiforme G11]|uniref:DNA 3'-5' helicase n=1 Tax=Cronartium quercuum f. sp. fusiforme G11 TaxID=708437 RepID=A0A9P6NKD7_9BASI|nr:hypothetical protein CROQUDRAFT_658266 [Cronartium quercuum f. sp. fusiforme G11]